MTVQIVVFVLSLGALCIGANFFLSAAENIGKALGFSPLVVGFFLVGAGTGLPELFVSHEAVVEGSPNIALGNLIGSNISNLLLIMGVAALLIPLHLTGKAIGHQLLLHGILMGLVGLIFYFGRLSLWSALPLLCFYIYFLRDLFHQLKSRLQEKVESREKRWDVLSLVKFVLGMVLLYFGGDFLVQSVSNIASVLGIGEYVISAVFVALGTSLPELVTVIFASRRENASDLILGNIIGSNIFNIACVMGSLGIYDIYLQNKLIPELSLLVGASLFLIVLAKLEKAFYRKLGVFFLLFYGGTVIYWLGL